MSPLAVLADSYAIGTLMLHDRGHVMCPDQRIYRVYTCAECGVQVDAEFAEATVWERVQRLRPTLIDVTAAQLARHTELRKVLAAVVYRPESGTFRLRWTSEASAASVRLARP